MKLIQIFAFALAMAAMAFGQAPSPSPQPGAKPSGTKSAATASAQAKPAPAAKKPIATAKKPVTAAKKPASITASTHAVPKAKPVKPLVKAHPGSATSANPSSSVPAKAHANGSSAVKPASAHAQSKPVVATGTLPAKAAPSPLQAKKSGSATTAHSFRPTVSPVPVKKGNWKSAARSANALAGSRSKMTAKPTVAAVPQKTSVAKVEQAKAEPKPPTPAKLLGAAGRRDPFVSPIRNASAVTPQSCASGKRCLAIPELVLQGTVRDVTGKMMAVVSTSNRRTYTLRENDQVYNGSVEKITSDSIIFREFVKDAIGRETAKEVVKKMGPTS